MTGRVRRLRGLFAPLAAAMTMALTAAAMPAMAEPPRTTGARSASHAGRRHARVRRTHTHTARQIPLKMIWGPLTLPDGSSAFPTYRRLGVQVLQLQLVWSNVAATRPSEPTNPADPAYTWPAALDQAISQAAPYGIMLAVLVKGTPPWANGGRDPTWTPNDPRDYANFIQAASRRYPSVHYWMIWGEPNGVNYKPMPAKSSEGPRRYAALLDAAYGALKAVNPSNLVIGGMTWTAGLVPPSDFLRWMRLPNGAPPRLDYFGHNPYSRRFPNLANGPILELPTAFTQRPRVVVSRDRDLSDIDTLHAELAAVYRHRRGGTPKLWLSEYSISSDSPNRGFEYFVSRAAQAHWMSAAFKLVDSVSYVAGLGWYELLDEPASVPGHLTEGLLAADGTSKPAFNAYARAR